MRRPNNYAFIDGANLHFTYENIDWELDYQKLGNYLRKRLNVSVAYYFLGKKEGNEKLYEALESYGYTLKLKEASPYSTEKEDCPYCHKVIKPELTRYKSDCDSYITFQIMSDFSHYDKAILITSDGDFDNLVKRLVAQDKLRLVFAPCKDGCSWLLKSAARNRIAYIDDYRNELEKTREGVL